MSQVDIDPSEATYEKIEVSKLQNWDENPRSITDKEYERLKEQIKRLGVYKPLLVNQSNIVLGGNMRLRALKDMGINEVMCAVVLTDNKAQMIEYALSDNEQMGITDEQKVAELVTLNPIKLELYAIQTGALKTIETVIADLSPEPEEDEPPEVSSEPPVSQLGSIYQLGRHRVMCGDSFKDTDTLMDGRLADMVFTDPPYNTGMNAKKNAGSTWLNHMFDDNYTPEQWEEFLSNLGSALYAVTKGDAAVYVCFAWKRNHELIPHLQDRFTLSNIIVWDKVVHGLGSDYQYTYELINVCKKGKPKLRTHQGDAEYQDVWHIQRQIGRNNDHATAKPITLCARAVKHASKTDDIVADLFLGSGSTLIACEQTDRTCYGMELDPKYVDVIRKRYVKFISADNELPEDWTERTPAI